ncbi:MAG: ribosomal protein L7/L12 [Paludibacteraceae bacterium]|nr:ribosomal protein L7/L12 [Paludibacteraceae bacterium]
MHTINQNNLLIQEFMIILLKKIPSINLTISRTCHPSITYLILNEAKGLVRQGAKLVAIKLIRDNTNADLKEAKDFVENIEQTLCD